MSLLSQINIEHSLWTDYVSPKRNSIRKRIKKWNNQSKNKINITFVADTIDTLISWSYTDLLTVKFVSRDWFFAKDRAEQMTYIARFDQSEQHYDQLYYQKEQDRYSMGVAIRYLQWRDDQSKAPTFVAINPLTAVPDPKPSQTGNFSINNYKFLGFHMRTSMYDMIKNNNYDTKDLNKLIANQYDAETEQNEQAYAEAYGTWIPTVETLTENFNVDIYHHLTIYKGRKWLVTTDAAIKTILKKTELKAVTKEEKENPLLIPRPVALNYWKPQRGNFFGESVWDYLEDKQDAMNIFANLAIATAKKEALWGRMLWNSRLIKNKEDILKPSVDTQHFWIDENQLQPGESIANAGIELPQPAIKSDVMWMFNFLETKGRQSVRVDALQQGIVPDKSMTKAEAQQIQANANLWLIRNKRVDSRWDKDFRFLYRRAYQEFFSPRDKKLVVLDSNFESDTMTYDKDTFSYTQMPYIKIGMKDELDAIDEKKKQFMSLYLPQVLQDPSKSQLVKDNMEREYLRLNKISQNQINISVPLKPDERIMIDDYIPMLNADIVPEWLFERVWDIFTAYVYAQQAQDTNAKKVVIETLKKVLSKSDIEQQMQPIDVMEWWWAMSNSAANIQMWQAAQQIQQPDLATRGNLSTEVK